MRICMSPYAWISLFAFALALITSLISLSGLWSVTESGPERQTMLLLSAGTLFLLLINSLLLLAWVYRSSRSLQHRRVAWLCLLSLLCCIGGDIVNFNLPQAFYRHGDVVRHDYLADSVLFFAPGYALLLAATVIGVGLTGRFRPLQITAALSLAAFAGGLSFAGMVLPGTGAYVASLTGAYALLITAVGMSGALLLAAYGLFRAPAGIFWVSLGLLLAAAADGIIGQFWIYGNGGRGCFPLVRNVNWIIYIGSQCLAIHLPRVLLLHDPADGHGIDRAD